MHRFVVVSMVVAGSCAAAVAAPPSLNLAQAFRDTKSLLNSGQTADILVLGDSLSFRPGSYLPYFRERMQNQFGNAGYGYQGFSLWSGAGLNNGWIRQGVNMDMSPHHSLDGLWSQYDGVAPFPHIAHTYPENKHVQVQYLTGPGGGSFDVLRGETSGGPSVMRVNTNSPTPGIGTFDYTMLPGESAFSYYPVMDGPITILGQNNTSGQNGVRIHRAANGGWGVGNFLQRDSTFDQQLQLIEPELVMVWLGQNDQGDSRTTYQPKLNALIDRVQAQAPAAEIVLVGTYDQGAPPLSGLVEAMADVATARRLGFINIFGTAGDSHFFENSGFLDDGVHFSPAGGDYLGGLMFDAFMTNGRSLAKNARPAVTNHDPILAMSPGVSARNVPEPAAGLALLSLAALRRRRA